jgi:hypothetical protein
VGVNFFIVKPPCNLVFVVFVSYKVTQRRGKSLGKRGEKKGEKLGLEETCVAGWEWRLIG